VSLTSFLTIAAGMLGCVLGGYRALQIGSRRVARYLLITSGLCLLVMPLLMGLSPLWFALLLAIWGAAASGDSPQFSTLVASYAPTESRGSTLTLVTSIGFLITVISIQTMAWLLVQFGASIWLFWLLLPGPMLGVLAVSNKEDR
jgi:MFS family permease